MGEGCSGNIRQTNCSFCRYITPHIGAIPRYHCLCAADPHQEKLSTLLRGMPAAPHKSKKSRKHGSSSSDDVDDRRQKRKHRKRNVVDDDDDDDDDDESDESWDVRRGRTKRK